MANSGKTRTIDEMDDIFEMVEVMKALGIAATGLKTLDEMKSRVKAELNQAEITPSWSAGQVRILIAVMRFYFNSKALISTTACYFCHLF